MQQELFHLANTINLIQKSHDFNPSLLTVTDLTNKVEGFK